MRHLFQVVIALFILGISSFMIIRVGAMPAHHNSLAVVANQVPLQATTSTPTTNVVPNQGQTTASSDWSGFTIAAIGWIVAIIAAIAGSWLLGRMTMNATMLTIKATAETAQQERDAERKERQKEQEEAQERERLATLRTLETELRMTAEIAGKFGDGLKVGEAQIDPWVTWIPMHLQFLDATQRYMHTLAPFVNEAIIKASLKTSRYNSLAELNNAFQAGDKSYQISCSGEAEEARKAQVRAVEYLETYINAQELKAKNCASKHTSNSSITNAPEYRRKHTIAIFLRLPETRDDQASRSLIYKDIGEHTGILIKNENLQLLGSGELDAGKRVGTGKFNETFSDFRMEILDYVYEGKVDDVPCADFYIILLGNRSFDWNTSHSYYELNYGGPAFSYDQLEATNWEVHLAMDVTTSTMPRLVKDPISKGTA